ncbi:MAG: hypothetical protein H0V96_04410 [Acidimicrobiia bacterium]|nr:hypothetical protein [Acidimicrobiia bacterium]
MVVRESLRMVRFVQPAMMTVLALVVTLSMVPAAHGAEPTDTTPPGSGSNTTTVRPGPATMTVTAGLDGRIAPDAPMVVDVELAARMLVVGTLELDFGSIGVTSVAVEVPAGGVKEYRLDSLRPERRTSYTVTLRDEQGAELASFTGRVRLGGTEMVGLLGIDGIDTSIRSARTTPMEGTPEVVSLEPDQIDGRIAPLTYLVAGEGALGRLTDEARAELGTWVRNGGRLFGSAEDLGLIGATTGTALLAGTTVAITRVGSGELGVMAAPADVTAAEWSRVIRDTPGNFELIDSAMQGVDGGLVVAASNGQEAEVPALPWLLAGILLFVVLVGPVNMLVLRALGRPEWSWVTIPALSLLFLGGFWFVGRAQLVDFTATHASVVVDDGQGHAVSDTGLLVQVATSGAHVLALDDGWQAYPPGGGFGGSMVEGVVEDRTVVFDLDDLGLGSTRLRWDEGAVGLASAVAATAEGLMVTVTNDTGWTLDGWGVVVGGRGFGSRDPLPTGASGSVEVLPGRSASPEPAVVPAATSSGEVGYELVRPLASHLEANWPVLRETASYVFGFTDERTVAVDLDGKRADGTGSTLVVRRFDLSDSDLVGLGSAVPQLLSVGGASSVERYGDEIYAYGAESVMFHYRVPAGIPTTATIGRVVTGFDTVEIYDWAAARFVAFHWERPVNPSSHVSAGGDMLVKVSTTDNETFMDQALRLQAFALRWTA